MTQFRVRLTTGPTRSYPTSRTRNRSWWSHWRGSGSSQTTSDSSLPRAVFESKRESNAGGRYGQGTPDYLVGLVPRIQCNALWTSVDALDCNLLELQTRWYERIGTESIAGRILTS